MGMSKKELWLNSDVFMCQINEGLVVQAGLVCRLDTHCRIIRWSLSKGNASLRSSCKVFFI